MVAGVEYLGQKYRSSVDFPHSVDRMEGEKRKNNLKDMCKTLGNKTRQKEPGCTEDLLDCLGRRMSCLGYSMHVILCLYSVFLNLDFILESTGEL